MPIKVINSGLATSVQDLGRPGYFHLGIPISGAMDRFAMRAANMLVGNKESAAGLEAVFMGPTLEFTEGTTIAVTGGELPPKIDGETKETWRALSIKAGQVLSFDYIREGARAYIAFAGGIRTPKSLGSRSTYAIGAMGGIGGRAIQAGDEIPIGASDKTIQKGRSIPNNLRFSPSNPAELRVLPGLYWHRITEAAGKKFFSETWTVAPDADRMGYRFKGGTPLEFVDREQPFSAGSDPSNITDAPYAYGSIQVPSGTEPIVLHRDAVSGGGFFTLGTVISADMDLIGQLQPNVKTNFVEVTMDVALSARRDRAMLLAKIREALN